MLTLGSISCHPVEYYARYQPTSFGPSAITNPHSFIQCSTRRPAQKLSASFILQETTSPGNKLVRSYKPILALFPVPVTLLYRGLGTSFDEGEFRNSAGAAGFLR